MAIPSVPGAARASAPPALNTDPGAKNGHILVFDGVSKYFGARSAGGPDAGLLVALKNVSAGISRGEFVTLLGPSGCGKTTLLRIAAGLLEPDEGTTSICNIPVDGPRKDACMVFQNFGLLPWRTVLGNVEFPLEIDGISRAQRRERARHLLGIVGLSSFEHHYPHELSGGMQQRVGIARAMMREPLLILMDEPFGALDAQTREQLQDDFLKIWKRTGMTVLFVTHSIDEALQLSDRIFVLSAQPGRLSAIIESPLAPYRMSDELWMRPEFPEYRLRLRRLLRGD